MKYNILLLITTLFLFSCLKDEAPFINIKTTEIAVESEGGSYQLSFEANKNWTAKSSADWCTIPQLNGSAKDNNVKILIAQNNTFEDRDCLVTIKVGELIKTVKINQSQSDAILLSSKIERISNSSQTLEIMLNTNVEIEVIVPNDAKDWITYINTRALTSETIRLDISANNKTTEERTAEIYLKDKTSDLEESVTIIQQGTMPSGVVVGSSKTIQHITNNSKDFIFQLNNLDDNEVFFVFTNEDENNSTLLPQLKSNYMAVSQTVRTTSRKETPFLISGKPTITEFNNNPWREGKKGLNKSQYQRHIAPKQSNNVVGTKETLYDDVGNSVNSTVRKVISANDKNLYVWVADNCWGSSSSKKHYITQEMVDELSSTFLKAGTNNDIYEWVTNIAGEPWGATNYDNLIADTDDIHIWLTDIDNDNKTTGTLTLGYYFARDNFLKSDYKNSNEKLMFTIDAVVFGKTENGSWSIDDYWQKQTISTLAHEFTHMIYFYQKEILRDQDSNTAINEMCAQCVEDLIADKILADGPRGVAHTLSNAGSNGNRDGRLPLYNENNNSSLLKWMGREDQTLINYSKTYAFGAYLMRNYGGSLLIRELIQNDDTGVNSIVKAVNANGGGVDSYATILQQFGVANLLSDRTNNPVGYKFNTARWNNSTSNGTTYKLGSINLFNFAPQPQIFNSLPYSQQAGSNLYYRAGINLSNNHEWVFKNMNPNTKLTVVIK